MSSDKAEPERFPGSSQSGKQLRTDIASATKLKLLKSGFGTGSRNQTNQWSQNMPIDSTSRSNDYLVPVQEGSPWEHFKILYDDLGGHVTVVCNKAAAEEIFIVKSIEGVNADEKLLRLRQLKHENLLTPQKLYISEDGTYAVSKPTAMALDHITAVHPEEAQLAAIVHQILKAISYLSAQNLCHGSINLSNVLLTAEGVVKLSNIENCSPVTAGSRSHDTQAIGVLMAELMNKHSGGNVMGTGSLLKLQAPKHWSEEIIMFVSATMSESIQKLVEHPFLAKKMNINELVPLIVVTQVSGFKRYNLKNSYMRRRLSM